jgi:cystathionine beta-synthase
VSLVCDSGNKYLSKVYNDYWMVDQGFLERPRFGDLRDLIARRHSEHSVATVKSDETALAALQRMKLYDVSQLPVMEEGRIVGLVTEEDLLLRVADRPGEFQQPVTAAMQSRLVTVAPRAPVSELLRIFDRGLVAIVVDGDEFLGLITRIDLLNWLRGRTALR